MTDRRWWRRTDLLTRLSDNASTTGKCPDLQIFPAGNHVVSPMEHICQNPSPRVFVLPTHARASVEYICTKVHVL
jgi:hypothetical protein